MLQAPRCLQESFRKDEKVGPSYATVKIVLKSCDFSLLALAVDIELVKEFPYDPVGVLLVYREVQPIMVASNYFV
jgi:hypothetical protein